MKFEFPANFTLTEALDELIKPGAPLLYRVRVVTTEHYTMEAESIEGAYARLAERRTELEQGCHHGEAVEISIVEIRLAKSR